MTTQAQEIEKIARRMAKGTNLPWHLFMPDASKEFVATILDKENESVASNDNPEE